jgi:hypothetical protein
MVCISCWVGVYLLLLGSRLSTQLLCSRIKDMGCVLEPITQGELVPGWSKRSDAKPVGEESQTGSWCQAGARGAMPSRWERSLRRGAGARRVRARGASNGGKLMRARCWPCLAACCSCSVWFSCRLLRPLALWLSGSLALWLWLSGSLALWLSGCRACSRLLCPQLG